MSTIDFEQRRDGSFALARCRIYHREAELGGMTGLDARVFDDGEVQLIFGDGSRLIMPAPAGDIFEDMRIRRQLGG